MTLFLSGILSGTSTKFESLNAMRIAEHKSDFKLTTNTPYLALTDELWDVYCEDFEENWLRCNGTVL